MQRILQHARDAAERPRDPVREPVVQVWNGRSWTTYRGYLDVSTRYLSVYRLNRSWSVPRDVDPIPLLDTDGEVRDGYQVDLNESEVRRSRS